MAVERNGVKYGACDTYAQFFQSCRAPGHLGVIQCTFLKKVACILKTAGRRAKRSDIWDMWILVTHIWGTFGLVRFKVIWGHLVHFLKMECTAKTAGRKVRRSQIWDSGNTSHTYMGYI